jgi:hypothetical protein
VVSLRRRNTSVAWRPLTDALELVMMVLVEGPDGDLVACRPALTHRILARMLAVRSDQRLALGVPPEQDVCLAVRAGHLVSSRSRRALVRSLRRLLAEARPPAGRSVTVLSPACRRRLAESRDAIGRIIDDLERPAPVSARGMAALCMLLRDGTGPVYGAGSARDLRERFGQVHGHLLLLSIWSN